MITVLLNQGQDFHGVSEIKLNNGVFALVDTEDIPLVSKYSWNGVRSKNVFYARTPVFRDGKRTTISMHRLVLGLSNTQINIDHVNRNGIDNRKANLRIASPAQNMANAIKRENCVSIYKGVSWEKGRSRWCAHISRTVNGRRIYKTIGYFRDEISAALAYDNALHEIHGEFARLNFPHSSTSEKILSPSYAYSMVSCNSAGAESPRNGGISVEVVR